MLVCLATSIRVQSSSDGPTYTYSWFETRLNQNHEHLNRAKAAEPQLGRQGLTRPGAGLPRAWCRRSVTNAAPRPRRAAARRCARGDQALLAPWKCSAARWHCLSFFSFSFFLAPEQLIKPYQPSDPDIGFPRPNYHSFHSKL